MSDKIRYVNHLKEEIFFGENVIAHENDLRNYLWDFDTHNGLVTNFRRIFTAKTLPFYIYGNTEEEATLMKNKVFEVFEKDVLANIKGTLWIGDYYYKCFVVGSVNSEYLSHKSILKKEVSIVTDNPVWVKETPYKFYLHQEIEGDRTYPYSYPYGYSNNLNSQRILNEHFTKSNFKIVIYGAVSNPTIYINGHPYTVNTELLSGEYLTISSLDKTVIKTKNNGDTVNEFNKRSKEYSVFEKIKQGSNTVSYDGNFDFEVILFEERSEPKWT